MPTETMAEAPVYKLSDAVALYGQTSGAITTLWAIYVAATFAAAGFGGASPSLQFGPALAVTCGFWAFALGHFALLRQALAVARVLGKAIPAALAARQGAIDPALVPPLLRLARTANPPWISLSIHLFIDLCVTAAIWYRR